MFTLPKKLKAYGWKYTDSWITNGCFAINQNHVKDRYNYMGDPSAKLENEAIERIIPDLTRCRKYIKTSVIVERGSNLIRIYINKDLNLIAGIDEEIVSHFELADLWGKTPSDPFINESLTMLVCPMRMDNITDMLAELFSAIICSGAQSV